MSKSETSQAQSVVGGVQAKAAKEQDDSRAVSSLHTHTQSPTQLLLMNPTTNQHLNKSQRPAMLTHLYTQEQTQASTLHRL